MGEYEVPAALRPHHRTPNWTIRAPWPGPLIRLVYVLSRRSVRHLRRARLPPRGWPRFRGGECQGR